jgi:hypothetical protein
MKYKLSLAIAEKPEYPVSSLFRTYQRPVSVTEVMRSALA